MKEVMEIENFETRHVQELAAQGLLNESVMKDSTHETADFANLIYPKKDFETLQDSEVISGLGDISGNCQKDVVGRKDDDFGEHEEETEMKYQDGEERSVTRGLLSISRATEGGEQAWLAGGGGKFEEHGGCRAVVKIKEILEELSEEVGADDYFDKGFNNDMERAGGHLLIGFKQKPYISLSHLGMPSTTTVPDGQEKAVSMEVQRSSALTSSPSSGVRPSTSTLPFQSSFPNPSDAANIWSRHLGFDASQKHLRAAVDDLGHCRHGPEDSFLSDSKAEDVRTVDGLFNEGLLKEALPNNLADSLKESYLIQGSDLETVRPLSYNGYANIMDSNGGDTYTSCNLGLGGMRNSQQEKRATAADFSLQRVLSDSISGRLMDDAMVAQCGHSFGINSLQRVMESNVCLNCGAPVPLGSLIPNYALRAAVQAYKREEQFWSNAIKGHKRRREHAELPENFDGKKGSWSAWQVPVGSTENTAVDLSRPKGVQFPFVVNDRVLIKGNKRTPERFVGREAIITTQCLNGWYLVRTLDNGESVRLQYRSLQKLGDKDLPTVFETIIHIGESGDKVVGGDACKGQSSASAPTSSSDDAKEGGALTSAKDAMVVTSFPSVSSEGLRTDLLSNVTHGIQRGGSIQASYMSGASWLSGRTSSNSSQEFLTDQSEEKPPASDVQEVAKAIEVTLANEVDRQGDKHVTETEKVTKGGSSPDTLEWQFRLSKNINNTCAGEEVGRVEDGLDSGDPVGTSTVEETCTLRSKQSILHAQGAHLIGSMDLSETDPYKKVYVLGSRRRTGVGDGHASLSTKQSMSSSLESGSWLEGNTRVKDHEQRNIWTSDRHFGSIKCTKKFLDSIQNGLFHLESEIPWSCLQQWWKRCQPEWLRTLQKSKTAKDIGNKLHELRNALLLTEAGGMSDKHWNEQLTAALESGKLESLASLWEKFFEDVSKLIESKPKRNRGYSSMINENGELAELNKLFPQLNVGRLSQVGITAATTVAAAEAFANGQLDTQTLLAVTVKLMQKHNYQDLLALREAIEREKRHINAKLMQFENAVLGREDPKNDTVDIDALMENPKQMHFSPFLLGVECPSVNVGSKDATAIPTRDGVGVSNIKGFMALQREETDGEATDMSDSD